MHEGGGAPQAAQGPKGLLRRATEVWALLGGLLLLVIALMISYSSAAGWLFGKPLPGDVELVEMLTAVSVFMFLPYCQIAGANVTADIFTARAGPRTVAILELLGVTRGVVALTKVDRADDERIAEVRRSAIAVE